MKRSILILSAICFSLFCLSGCDLTGLSDPDNGDFETYEDEPIIFESANAALMDYAIHLEYLKITGLQITSEDFTRPILMGDIEKVDKSLIADWYAHQEHMMINIDSYIAAVKAFDEAGFMRPDTRIGIIGTMGAIATIVGIYEFEKSLADSRERGAKAIENTFNKMSPADQEKAFEAVPLEFRKDCKNAKDFIKKVKARKLGNHVNSIHNLLMYATDGIYYDAAEQADAGIAKRMMEETCDIADKGFSMVTEPIEGFDYGEDLVKLSEKEEKLAKSGKKASMVEVLSAKTEMSKWLQENLDRQEIQTVVDEHYGILDIHQKHRSATLSQEFSKLKVNAKGGTGMIAIATRKNDPSLGYPITYLIPVGKSTVMTVEGGDYEVLVADEVGYVDAQRAELKGGTAYVGNFDTRHPNPSQPVPDPDGSKPDTNYPASVTNAEREFGRTVQKIKIHMGYNLDASFKWDMYYTDETPTYNNITGKGTLMIDDSSTDIQKRVELNQLIYTVQIPSLRIYMDVTDNSDSSRTNYKTVSSDGTLTVSFDCHTRELLSLKITVKAHWEGPEKDDDFVTRDLQYNLEYGHIPFDPQINNVWSDRYMYLSKPDMAQTESSVYFREAKSNTTAMEKTYIEEDIWNGKLNKSDLQDISFHIDLF